MAAYAGQFVPLKLTTSGGPEWSRWAAKYPHEGKGIPIIYVIRADGTMLYGKTGSLPGQELHQVLIAALAQSGRSFTSAESVLLVDAVDMAKISLAEGDRASAARALGQLKRLAPLGELSRNSFSPVGQEADRLVKEFIEAAESQIEKAQADFGDPDKSFRALLELVEAADAYRSLPPAKAAVQRAMGPIQRNAELGPTLTQAQALHRARRLARAQSASDKRRAAAAYQSVMERYPDTPAAALAREELAAINPEAGALEGDAGGPTGTSGEFRVWTDVTGKHKTKAKLVGIQDGKVHLQKEDGESIVVALERLSDNDRAFLQRD